ncbi:hypothetical protein [Limnohabitans sp. T6-20]|uniref:hypothetical protein n=1 Tax=Limnohabitans sp. T6-20 TaxID=1100725 RepID=UPI000D3A093E|nr:hypothetical protein [Limnohabitans sp. T6-20]PUE08178.1 hypothetical protein B9Z33_14820 [Limnohabitans sp. T6-20]
MAHPRHGWRWWNNKAQTGFLMKNLLLTVLLFASAAQVMAADAYPTVRVRDIPEGLKMVWRQTRPEMTETSRCAAAFDNHSDVEKMTLQCSVHIKMAAEGARRAMRYCEEKRQELKIKESCRMVTD